MAEVLAETLSPKGKLFEIYFVRLIGTPNQQFKKTILASAGIMLVVHESLGSELFSESLILAQNERWRRG